MHRLTFSGSLFAALFLLASARADDAALSTDNAALLYWQAIAVMPKEVAIANGPRANPVRVDSPECRALFEESRVTMELLRHAATKPMCDWGIDYLRAPLFAIHARVRDLARLAKFSVEFQASSGKKDDAVDDALAMLALARNFGRGQPTAPWLLGCVLESQAIETLAELVGELDKIQLFRLSRRWEALPSRAALADALRLEAQGQAVWVLQAIEDGPATERFETLRKLMANEEWLEAFVEQTRKDPESARTRFGALKRRFEEWTGLMPLSRAEFDKRLAAMMKSIREEADPMVMGLLPIGMESTYDASRKVEAQYAALQAGIAYRREGNSGLLKFPDPADGKPFLLTETPHGFELRSQILHLEKTAPVVVRFGLPAVAR